MGNARRTTGDSGVRPGITKLLVLRDEIGSYTLMTD
jgi:hypothetical protein